MAAKGELRTVVRVAPSATTAPAITSSASSATELVREFLVDGLGILLPGVGFCVACIPAVVAPLGWLVYVLDSYLLKRGATQISITSLLSGTAIAQLSKTITSFHTELFLAMIGLSYIIGHLLFRQDIKIPDQKSFLRANSPPQTKVVRYWRWIVRLCGSEARFPLQWTSSEEPQPSICPTKRKNFADRLKPEIPIKVDQDKGVLVGQNCRFDGMARPTRESDLSHVKVEYPYHFLSEYLEERGFYHLTPIIPWAGHSEFDLSKRTKHFINLLKANLHQSGSLLINTVGKNEAHIRLASSVWYAASYVSYLSLLGMLFSLVADIVTYLAWGQFRIALFLVSAATLIVAVFAQSAIEKSLHYQRTREIFFVLHAAALINKQKGNTLFGVSATSR